MVISPISIGMPNMFVRVKVPVCYDLYMSYCCPICFDFISGLASKIGTPGAVCHERSACIGSHGCGGISV